ncbi:DNA polymerase IV 1 [Paraconexibacter sp. AEG42_29]|uniref:DNA polymerase IV n=1 Tax=Paraconexibacter sp. AEG42_29 TaxID=2997339 RepID=A0AAU7AVB4_9ACTN
MIWARTILHADLDAFFASVEQRDDPRLQGRPVIVGGGVVLAASYEARAHGVRSAMGGRRAQQLCPQAIVVPPRFEAYVAASREVFTILDALAGRVEHASIDEGYIEPGGEPLTTDGVREFASGLRRAVRDRAGLPISIGAAPSKVVAKIASAMAKPDGLLVVEPDGVLDFLHPLEVDRIPGVGPATGERLNAHGLVTVGDLAAAGEAALVEVLGKAGGRRLHAIAHGRETTRLQTTRRRRSYGAQRALGRRRLTDEELQEALDGLVERVANRMAARGARGRTVVLRLRYADFERGTRSYTLPRATGDARALGRVAATLLRDAARTIEQRGVTLVGVTISGIERDDDGQLVLPLDPAA